MHNRFDQLGKQIGRQALGPSGPTVVHDEIAPDAQQVDIRHEPDPGREAERARLGLLGRLASVLCLIEIYGHAPDAAEFRACLGKHIAFWQQQARRARAHKRTSKPGVLAEPFLWIIAAGAPTALLTKLKLDRAPSFPPGVYFFGDEVLRVGLVVASELPRDRSTLLVRLMAAGPLLPRAIEDLSALPKDAHERVVAGQILVNLQHALGRKPNRTPEELEFVMTMQDSWEKAREEGLKQGHKEGRSEGRKEGRSEGLQEARVGGVLMVLRMRGIAVPDAARERILAEKDPERLERWLERSIVATSLAEVLGEPS